MKIRSADCNVWTPRRLLSGAAYRCHVRWSAGARHRTFGPEVRHIRIRVWTGVMRPPEGRQSDTQLLVAAQRAWVAFRDAESAFSGSGVSGGTAHGMILAICLDKLTGKNIDDFKDYLKCQEGALDCPIPAK